MGSHKRKRHDCFCACLKRYQWLGLFIVAAIASLGLAGLFSSCFHADYVGLAGLISSLIALGIAFAAIDEAQRGHKKDKKCKKC
jgi:uncharacterized membrane protein